MPDDRTAWVARGIDLELDDVLTKGTLPQQMPLRAGMPRAASAGRTGHGQWTGQ